MVKDIQNIEIKHLRYKNSLFTLFIFEKKDYVYIQRVECPMRPMLIRAWPASCYCFY